MLGTELAGVLKNADHAENTKKTCDETGVNLLNDISTYMPSTREAVIAAAALGVGVALHKFGVPVGTAAKAVETEAAAAIKTMEPALETVAQAGVSIGKSADELSAEAIRRSNEYFDTMADGIDIAIRQSLATPPSPIERGVMRHFERAPNLEFTGGRKDLLDSMRDGVKSDSITNLIRTASADIGAASALGAGVKAGVKAGINPEIVENPRVIKPATDALLALSRPIEMSSKPLFPVDAKIVAGQKNAEALWGIGTSIKGGNAYETAKALENIGPNPPQVRGIATYLKGVKDV